MPGTGTPDGAEVRPGGGRIEPVRRLVSGRALIGALLVATAGVGAFAAHLDATRGPQDVYVVARGPVAAGTRLGDLDQVRELFGVANLDLGALVGERAVAGRDLDTLVGQVLLAPLEHGELLQRSVIEDLGAGADVYALSFALPRSAAVGGGLRPGEHIDVVATVGTGPGARTIEVVRRVPLLAVVHDDRALVGGSAPLELTVALDSSRQVRELAHAINTADLLVVRSPAGVPGPDAPDRDAATPPPSADGGAR